MPSPERGLPYKNVPHQDESNRHIPIRVDEGVPAIPPIRKAGLRETLTSCFGNRLKEDISGNEVRTAKYTFLTFFPINLFEQFSRLANQYFALIAILQMIPGLSPTSPITTLFPLGFVLLVNMVKEIYDDFFRHREDSDVNFREVKVLKTGSGWVSVCWKDLRVGDVVRIQRGMEFPADMIFLSSDDKEGLCYVETANLDGETNLKLKHCFSPASGDDLSHESNIKDFAGRHTVVSELPNARLYEFEGAVLETCSGERAGIDASSLLLRGCTLRKTQWVIGMVVFAGYDTKMLQNGTNEVRKVTQLEQEMNRLVIMIFCALLALSLFSAVMNQVAGLTYLSTVWYLNISGKWPDLGPGLGGFFVELIRFIILYNQLIPISLYVGLEVVKVIQSFFMNCDLQMYHEPSDTPFACRTTTLNEDLGQVQYVLSDKTGTLTENLMAFMWCSIGGTLHGHDDVDRHGNSEWQEHKYKHEIVYDQQLGASLKIPFKDLGSLNAETGFLLALAVCNSVVPHKEEDEAGKDKLVYQAESPDEEALVEGAAALGVKLLKRTPDMCNIEVQGRTFAINICAVFEFSSDRKRMSIVCQTPDGSCHVWCKGADNVILDRLGPNQNCLDETSVHLGEMSRAGFRTLCIAHKHITQSEFDHIAADFKAASASPENRDKEISEVAHKVESDLTLIGATAVEDKLQDGVPETIAALLRAGIRLWVLTGDKLETAISIAITCNLFTATTPLVILRGDDLNTVATDGANIACQALDTIRRRREQITQAVEQNRKVGLVIDGAALSIALLPEVECAFLELCKDCDAVVCCRVSPMQKAQVTNLVKVKCKAITLGIGDGANDVGMIQAAHIGCGISGREGRAAVMSSDFAFAQFSYLKRLLLVHGHWSYRRNEQVVFYAFYRNVAYVLGNFYYAFLTAFSAQPLYDAMMIGTYNFLWTSLPTIAYACLEQNLDPRTLQGNPELYKEVMSMTRPRMRRMFSLWILSGVWHSLAVFWIPFFSLPLGSVSLNGQTYDGETLGVWVFTAVIITVNLKIAIITRYWTWISHVFLWIVSIGCWWPVLWVASLLYGSIFRLFPELAGIGSFVFTQPAYWLSAVILTPIMATIPDFIAKVIQHDMFPTDSNILQEFEHLHRRSVKKDSEEGGALSDEARIESTVSAMAHQLEEGSMRNLSSHEMQVVTHLDLQEHNGSLPPVAVFLSRCASLTPPPSPEQGASRLERHLSGLSGIISAEAL